MEEIDVQGSVLVGELYCVTGKNATSMLAWAAMMARVRLKFVSPSTKPIGVLSVAVLGVLNVVQL